MCSSPPTRTGWRISPLHTGRSSHLCSGCGCGSLVHPPWREKRQKHQGHTKKTVNGSFVMAADTKEPSEVTEIDVKLIFS